MISGELSCPATGLIQDVILQTHKVFLISNIQQIKGLIIVRWLWGPIHAINSQIFPLPVAHWGKSISLIGYLYWFLSVCPSRASLLGGLSKIPVNCLRGLSLIDKRHTVKPGTVRWFGMWYGTKIPYHTTVPYQTPIPNVLLPRIINWISSLRK